MKCVSATIVLTTLTIHALDVQLDIQSKPRNIAVSMVLKKVLLNKHTIINSKLTGSLALEVNSAFPSALIRELLGQR